jgi:ribonuclease P protein component
VSRKVSKSAVRRNRVRRRIYEVVRHMDTDISPAIDLVFTVFDEHVADMQTDKLQAIIRQLIQQTAEH